MRWLRKKKEPLFRDTLSEISPLSPTSRTTWGLSVDSNRKSLHRKAMSLSHDRVAPPLSYILQSGGRRHFWNSNELAAPWITSCILCIRSPIRNCRRFFFLLTSCRVRKNESRNYRKVSAADDVLVPRELRMYIHYVRIERQKTSECAEARSASRSRNNWTSRVERITYRDAAGSAEKNSRKLSKLIECVPFNRKASVQEWRHIFVQ